MIKDGNMNINGYNKLTLLDYPGHLAATIFLGGCNFRCPFCHNASLVMRAETQPVIPTEEVLSSLSNRRNILEGVCVTGGEPTLSSDLFYLVSRIKELGLKIKLDTNGTNPVMLKALVKDKLIDYVAMDIKNSREKYQETSGAINLCMDDILESVDFLLSDPIEYEFRTTIVKELHTEEDMLSIGKWIKGAKAYYLQSYKDSGDIILSGYHSHTKETLLRFADILSCYIDNTSLRGID
jgi:pyruvate formate lyase activating enzyme